MLSACYGPLPSPPQIWVRLSVTINHSANNEKSRLSWLATKHCNIVTIIKFYELRSNFKKQHEFHKIYKKKSNNNNNNNNNNIIIIINNNNNNNNTLYILYIHTYIHDNNDENNNSNNDK